MTVADFFGHTTNVIEGNPFALLDEEIIDSLGRSGASVAITMIMEPRSAGLS